MRLRDDSAEALRRIAQTDARETALSRIHRLDAPTAVAAIRSSMPMRRPEAVALPGRQSGKALPLSKDTTAAVFGFHASGAKQVIRVMMAAACADGVVDEQERRRIADYLADAGSTPEELAFAEEQLHRPVVAEDLARGVTSGEMARELYAAALLVSQTATPGTQAFLGRFASALRLEPKFVADLHAAWGNPPPVRSA